MNIINKPKVSRVIALVYEILVIFIVALAGIFLYAAFFTPMGIVGIVASATSTFVGLIMLLILLSLFRTRYILTDEELIIKTTRLIGGGKTIPMKTITSVEKTMIPFGIRLFGASFHGGTYHIPSLGRAFLCITNFSDGLLIKTIHGNYLITPSNPSHFKEAIEDKVNLSKSP